MVQYRASSGPADNRHLPSFQYNFSADYWKLYDYRDNFLPELEERLRAKGYAQQSYDDEDRLRQLNLRADRGLLSYDACSNAELRTFAAQRNITLLEDLLTKSEYILALEAADNNQTFDRFLDLPAELREMVYEAYLAPFVDMYTSRAMPEPPLSKVSRAMRQESLPVFYRMRILDIKFRKLHVQRSGSPSQNTFVMESYDAKRMVEKGPEALLRHKRFTVSTFLTVVRKNEWNDGVSFKWRIALPTSGTAFELAAVEDEPAIVHPAEKAFQGDVQNGLYELLQSVVAREGEIGLIQSDVTAIENIFRRAWIRRTGRVL